MVTPLLPCHERVAPFVEEAQLVMMGGYFNFFIYKLSSDAYGSSFA